MLRLRSQVPVDRGLNLKQVLDHILQVVCRAVSQPSFFIHTIQIA